jgi:hypothetical protein
MYFKTSVVATSWIGWLFIVLRPAQEYFTYMEAVVGYFNPKSNRNYICYTTLRRHNSL